MSEHERSDDSWVAAALKAEAERYEPDHARIRRRVHEGLPTAADPTASSRPSAWLPAAAAALVVATAGVITAVHWSERPSAPAGAVQVVAPAPTSAASARPDTSATSAPGATSGPAATSGASVTPGVPASSAGPVRSAGPVGPTGPAGSGAPALPGPAKPGPVQATSGPGVDLTSTVATAGQVVTLPADSVDWIVAGPQSANETIRRQNGSQLISGPHLTGDPTATVTTGPFAVTWSGGMPEESHVAARTWLTVSGPAAGPETGLIVRAPAGRSTSELMLYVGANGADGRLEAQVTDAGPASTIVLKAGARGTGYAVRIRFRSQDDAGTVNVRLISGSGGAVSLAAASLH